MLLFLFCFSWWKMGFPGTCQCRRHKRRGFDPWIGKINWTRKLKHTPVFLPEKVHGQKSLKGYDLWGHKDMTEQLNAHTHILKIICMIQDCKELVCTPLKKILNHCALNYIVLVFILVIL